MHGSREIGDSAPRVKKEKLACVLFLQGRQGKRKYIRTPKSKADWIQVLIGRTFFLLHSSHLLIANTTYHTKAVGDSFARHDYLRCCGLDWAQRRNCQRSSSSHFCRKYNQGVLFLKHCLCWKEKKKNMVLIELVSAHWGRFRTPFDYFFFWFTCSRKVWINLFVYANHAIWVTKYKRLENELRVYESDFWWRKKKYNAKMVFRD